MTDIPELPEYLFHKKRANIVEDINVVKLFNNYAHAPESMKVIGRQLIKEGWVFQVVEQVRGRCYGEAKIITIPLWVLVKGASMIRWYICHEMAHALVGIKHQHDEVFMGKLKEICPLEDQYHEFDYKPRNAKSAGLSEIGVL